MTPSQKKRPAPRPKLKGDEIVPSEREAPAERSLVRTEFIAPVLNDAQMRLISNQTPEWAIRTRVGRGGSYRYVPHGYVTDQLNKIFGFDWDFIQVPGANGEMFNLNEEDVPVYGRADSKTHKAEVISTDRQRHVTVFGYIEARVHTKDGDRILKKSGVGSQLWLPGAELGDAVKGALSDCLKVCAQRFGVALDLYYSEENAISAAEKKRAESAEAAKAQVDALLSQPPATLPVLIARASAERGLTKDDLERIAGVTLLDMMRWDSGQIQALWKKLPGQIIDGEAEA